MKSTSINGVKTYSFVGHQRSMATWLNPNKLRALRKDKGFLSFSFFNWKPKSDSYTDVFYRRLPQSGSCDKKNVCNWRHMCPDMKNESAEI